MRNWNWWAVDTRTNWENGFYSTYEELKPYFSLVCPCVSISFLQYLWGIETLDIVSRQIIPDRVFTVPMRNWNFNTACLNSSDCWRFYSTYEELKLIDWSPVSAFDVVGFYSTYEELKPILVGNNSKISQPFLQYLWGIETNYN